MIGNTEQSYGITYKDISGLLDTYTTPHNSFTYSYDNFDRLTRKLGDKHSIQYTYVNGSQRVDTYTISQATAQQTVYAYTYDNLGNITSVKKNGTTVSNYEYDKLGRLIREDDCANSTAWVYTYDNAGNLLKKYTFYGLADGIPAAHLLSIHPYNGSEISATYTYSTSEWGDLLTNYNGTTITYDAIGNPLKWRNASSLTWDKRALQSMTLSNGSTLSFGYNADGIRTQKYYNNNLAQTTYVHNYILDGSTILGETISSVTAGGSGTTTLYYYYDESGISGISYNGTKYSYVRNLQGDVIAILSSYGATMVEYEYDAWGNVLSITGALASTLGAVNPFRYRGYYYDTETGFYYLQSRYYDPQVGRFINADGIIGANGGIMGYNLFAYCSNNPVMFADKTGKKSSSINWEETEVRYNGATFSGTVYLGGYYSVDITIDITNNSIPNGSIKVFDCTLEMSDSGTFEITLPNNDTFEFDYSDGLSMIDYSSSREYKDFDLGYSWLTNTVSIDFSTSEYDVSMEFDLDFNYVNKGLSIIRSVFSEVASVAVVGMSVAVGVYVYRHSQPWRLALNTCVSNI